MFLSAETRKALLCVEANIFDGMLKMRAGDRFQHGRRSARAHCGAKGSIAFRVMSQKAKEAGCTRLSDPEKGLFDWSQKHSHKSRK